MESGSQSAGKYSTFLLADASVWETRHVDSSILKEQSIGDTKYLERWMFKLPDLSDVDDETYNLRLDQSDLVTQQLFR